LHAGLAFLVGKKRLRALFLALLIFGILEHAILAAPSPTQPTLDLFIFGDDEDRRFLGCLSCSKFASNSVQNQYGQYGSPYATYSIWNKYGRYGSQYSSYSPCNPAASRPPAIVDENWMFQGRLTLNARHPQAFPDPDVLNWLRFGVCRS
jgi:hypothetical protein